MEYSIENNIVSSEHGFVELDHPVKECVRVDHKLFLLVMPEDANTPYPSNVICLDLNTFKITWRIDPGLYIMHPGPPNEMDIISNIVFDADLNAVVCFPWDGPHIAINAVNFAVIERKGARWGLV